MLVQPVTGEVLTQKKKSLVLSFPSERLVLSTSVYNGGIREDLTAVFNYDCKSEETGRCELRAESYEEELRLTALDLGLDPLHTTGLSTAAQMKNAAQFSESFEGVTVTAIATGGIDINAVRAGDPASYCERSGVFESLTPGTINLFVIIGCRLSPGSLARALVTCTEAKAAAVQEWLIPSCYSHGIATGSGTDGTILVCNPASPIELTDAGTHAKLGEMLAGCVKSQFSTPFFFRPACVRLINMLLCVGWSDSGCVRRRCAPGAGTLRCLTGSPRRKKKVRGLCCHLWWHRCWNSTKTGC